MSSRTMSRRLRFLLLAGLVLALGGAGIWYFVERQKVCCAFPDNPPEMPEAELGLMTGLPLYWPLGTGVSDLAGGDVAIPWQRAALEQSYRLVPLDTLSPIPDLDPDAPEIDPLAGLTKLAIIQPRGLSPADNVALDNWVRAGGELLIALDPALTLDYPVPFGDPRRPTASASIPPVIDRWGMAIAYEDHSYHGHAIDADVQLEALERAHFPFCQPAGSHAKRMRTALALLAKSSRNAELEQEVSQLSLMPPCSSIGLRIALKGRAQST